MKTVISHLKFNSRMYAMIADDDNARHFIIKGIDFGYIIYGEVVIISNCRFVKSNTKLKVRQNQFIWTDSFFIKTTIYLVDLVLCQEKVPS